MNLFLSQTLIYSVLVFDISYFFLRMIFIPTVESPLATSQDHSFSTLSTSGCFRMIFSFFIEFLSILLITIESLVDQINLYCLPLYGVKKNNQDFPPEPISFRRGDVWSSTL